MRKHLSREERMRQVVRVLEALQRWHNAINVEGNEEGFTATAIAKSIGMQPSTHFREILNACVVAGWIDCIEGVYRAHVDRYTYWVTELGRELVQEMRQEGMF